MDKIIDWLVHSSVDADKVSAWIKGLAVFAPSLAMVFALTRTPVSDGSIVELIQQIALAISLVGTLAGAAGTILGMTRKIVTTAMGSNAVLNRYE